MKKKVKVLHVAHAVGGVDVSIRQIIGHLSTDAFVNHVVHGMTDTQQPFLDASLNQVPSWQIQITRNIGLKDILGLWQMIRLARKIKPDIIHGHSAKGGVYCRIAALFCSAKAVYTPQAFSYFSAENPLLRSVYLWIEKCLSKIGYFVACSASERSRALNEVGYPANRVFLFNNAIAPVQPWPPSSKISLPDTFLCTVGRPSYQKNIEKMIDVLHELNKIRPTHLVLLGVGHHADRLEAVKARIQQYQLQDKVHLFAWTDRETTLSILNVSKIYLSCARYEGLPYAIIEAASLGIPCVVSDCDGNRDVVQNQYNGFVIKSDEVSQFVEKILALDDTQLYQQLSENAKEKFAKEFNIQHTISQLEHIYKHLLSN